MSRVCRSCGPGVLYGDDEVLCPEHIRDLEPQAEATAAPTPEWAEPEAVPDDGRSCWSCGAEVPHPSNTECVNPACRRSLTPPGLVIRFPAGEVTVAPGSRAELGRRGAHAGIFRDYPNVSRHHAVVGAEPGGRAWIEPGPAPNGTFLDGAEIPVAERRDLHSHQRIRLGLHAEGTVTVHAVREG
ncbi:FHA domain-containing protein [Actinoplanes sp. NPDC051851]|uniref:FHA domain-containing protein n=1 Tax=Actinoplanes sp. NPDC051851 TaxID=3154753 RepID=UPI003428F500